jgi:hypothetical protein
VPTGATSNTAEYRVADADLVAVLAAHTHTAVTWVPTPTITPAQH